MTDVSRLFDFPYYQLKKYPQEVCFAGKENGSWRNYSTQEFIDKCNLISKGLLKLGVQPGDKIALISTTNRPEWNITDIGILQIGAIDVPVYPTISRADYKYIFNEAEVKYCFVSDADLFTKISDIRNEVPSLKEIYSYDKVDGAVHWSSLMEGCDDVGDERVLEIMNQVKSTDLATIIYTSGTTGLPKGVMLSHNNIVSNVLAVRHCLPLGEGDSGLSFLPVCHVYERMMHYLYLYVGANCYFAESLDTIKDNIVEVRPHAFTAVPRLLEKVYDGIVSKGTATGGVKAMIFKWALCLTESYEYGQTLNFQRKIADKLVYSKIRQGLGNRVAAIASGSAALQPRLARFFHAIGLSVFEGYGLTETSPVVSVNYKNNVEFGSVGPVIRDVEVRIASDGEILVKGPNVMMGYYKADEKTNEVLKDGWFHTGDIGELNEHNVLKITDRKKEIFKTSGGKYIAPQVMENKFKESRFIEQIMVIGENEKLPSALIVPAFEYLKSWCRENNIDFSSSQAMICNSKVKEAFAGEITRLNQAFGDWEQIKKFELLCEEWTVESDQLTPTLKLKRKNIMEACQTEYRKIYGNSK